MQGNYSHGLAEHTLAACLWFAKDLPRYRAQQNAKLWRPYNIEYLRWAPLPLHCNNCKAHVVYSATAACPFAEGRVLASLVM